MVKTPRLKFKKAKKTHAVRRERERKERPVTEESLEIYIRKSVE